MCSWRRCPVPTGRPGAAPSTGKKTRRFLVFTGHLVRSSQRPRVKDKVGCCCVWGDTTAQVVLWPPDARAELGVPTHTCTSAYTHSRYISNHWQKLCNGIQASLFCLKKKKKNLCVWVESTLHTCSVYSGQKRMLDPTKQPRMDARCWTQVLC